MITDPTTLILSALASGATIVQATTNKTVEEAYSRLKTLIQKKFLNNSEAMFVLDKYVEKPDVWEAPLKDELMQVNADKDKEIIETAKTLMSLQESQQQADYEHFAAEADNLRKQLQEMYEESHYQFEQWLRFSLIAAILGFVVIVVGLITILAGNISIGLLALVASLISEAIAALFSLQARKGKRRVDTINEQLVQSERVYQIIELALMTDGETRNRLKGVLIDRLLNLSAEEQELSSQQLSA